MENNIDLKKLFIDYLNKNYKDIFYQDFLGEKNGAENVNTLICNPDTLGITDYVIEDLKARDDDEIRFTFRIRLRLKSNEGMGNFYDMEYSCLLDDGIKDLKFNGLKDRLKFDDNLTKYFIPYIPKARYEEFGERFAKKYYGNNWNNCPLSYLDMFEKLGVTPSVIQENMGSFGLTIFKDCCLTVGDETYEFKKGTIVFSSFGCLLNGSSFHNETIFHEFMHWHFHRKAFEILNILGISCNTSGSDFKKNEAGPLSEMFNLMEVQANAIEPIVLMPKDVVLAEYNARINDIDENDLEQVRKVCCELSNYFDVTLSKVIKRLNNLGISSVKSLLENNNIYSINDIKVHRKLANGETYYLTREQEDIILKDKLCNFFIIHEIFVLVEGYIVINNEKYVKYLCKGLPTLSDYAKEHIEECALSFYFIINNIHNYNSFFLNRDKSNINSIAVKLTPTSREILLKTMRSLDDRNPNKREFFSNYEEESDDRTFSEYLNELIDKSNKTLKKIEIASKGAIKEVTIKNYKTSDQASPEITKVLAICCVLKLYPYESKKLIDKTTYNLNVDTPRNKVYRDLIFNHYGENITSWNEILKASKAPTLL